MSNAIVKILTKILFKYQQGYYHNIKKVKIQIPTMSHFNKQKNGNKMLETCMTYKPEFLYC